jgi:hypothetical protein
VEPPGAGRGRIGRKHRIYSLELGGGFKLTFSSGFIIDSLNNSLKTSVVPSFYKGILISFFLKSPENVLYLKELLDFPVKFF